MDAGIDSEHRDAFIAHASSFDHDGNNYLKKQVEEGGCVERANSVLTKTLQTKKASTTVLSRAGDAGDDEAEADDAETEADARTTKSAHLHEGRGR